MRPRAADEKLAFDAVRLSLVEVIWIRDADLGVWEGDSDVAGTAGVGQRIAGDDWRGFSKAVAFN